MSEPMIACIVAALPSLLGAALFIATLRLGRPCSTK
jgi:hypothetical protein